MARSLKTRGMEELKALKKRVLRQHGMERISSSDKNYIVQRLDEIEARIISMEEKDEPGGSPW